MKIMYIHVITYYPFLIIIHNFKYTASSNVDHMLLLSNSVLKSNPCLNAKTSFLYTQAADPGWHH